MSGAGRIIEHVFDFEGVSDDGLVDALRDAEGTVRAAQARQFAIIAEVRARAGSWIVAGGERFVSAVDVAAAEIGPVLSLSRHAATDRVTLAEALTGRLPGTRPTPTGRSGNAGRAACSGPAPPGSNTPPNPDPTTTTHP